MCCHRVTVLEETLRGHPVHPPSLRNEQLFPQLLTDALPLIITVNMSLETMLCPQCLQWGLYLRCQMHSIVEKKSSFLLFTCVGLEDQRNPEEKGKKQYFMLENYQDSEHKGAFCGLGFF